MARRCCAVLLHDTTSLLSRPPNTLINDIDGIFEFLQTQISLSLLLSAFSAPTMASNSQVAAQNWLPGAGEGCHLVLMNATTYTWKRKETGSYQLTAWRFPKDIKPGERHSQRRHCRNLTVFRDKCFGICRIQTEPRHDSIRHQWSLHFCTERF